MYAERLSDNVIIFPGMTRLPEPVAPEIADEEAMDEEILTLMEQKRFFRALKRGQSFAPRAVALPANSRPHPSDLP